MGLDLISFAYAATVTGGGVMGYVKAGSVMSLAAGLLFGSMIGYGAYLSSANPSDIGFLFGSTTVLFLLMGYRYSQSGKVMPAGLIAALSGAMLVRLGIRAVGIWTSGK